MPDWLLPPICLAALVALPAHPQTIAGVTIHGEFIMEDDVEQRAKFDFMITHKQSIREDVIRQLAVDMTKIREAEGRGLLANAQVDKAFADMCSRMGVTPEQLTKSLEEQGIRLDTLRRRIKADVARESLAGVQNRFEDGPLIRQK
jgi:peptidyl-prolyl cis-trans isomerase SurA